MHNTGSSLLVAWTRFGAYHVEHVLMELENVILYVIKLRALNNQKMISVCLLFKS